MELDRSYDGDLALWAEDQARALRSAARARLNLPIDWENVAEEIESLGKSQGRELASRVRTVLVHLMKLQTSPAADPRPGWRATVRRERAEIEAVLRDSPSLRQTVPGVIAAESPAACRIAEADMLDYGEPSRPDLAQARYSADQVLGDRFPDWPLTRRPARAGILPDRAGRRPVARAVQSTHLVSPARRSRHLPRSPRLR